MKKTQPDSCDRVARVDGGRATLPPGRPAEGSFNGIVSLIEAARARSMQAIISREALWSGRGAASALGGWKVEITVGNRSTKGGSFRYRTPMRFAQNDSSQPLSHRKRVEEREVYLRIATRNRRSLRFERAVPNPPRLSTQLRESHLHETCANEKKVSALLTQLPWAHNLIILGRSRRPQERKFDLRPKHSGTVVQKRIGRHSRLGVFERMAPRPKVSPAVTQFHGEAAASIFKDRTLSPALIAEYQTQLLDKKLLAAKLHEFYALNAVDQDAGGLQP
jgi:hypothetical protein